MTCELGKDSWGPMSLISTARDGIRISVVCPIYNEQENLHELYRRLSKVLEAIGERYEILLVDDYSQDASREIIAGFCEQDSHVRSLRFSRNFGHQTAITAGMQHARGELVILMDGDLQDPPEVLPDLIAKHETEGWDVIYAIRRRRKENLLYRAAYRAFYRLLQRLSYIEIPLDSGDFCLMHRRVVNEINALPERNRFVRGIRSWVGFRQTGFEYERQARHAGEAKYTFRSLLRLAMDGIFSFSYTPLHTATWGGFWIAIFGIIYAFYTAIMRLNGHMANTGWTTIIVAVLIMGGLNMLMLGIIGEYIGRIFEETKGRPQYIVEDYIGFEEDKDDEESVTSASETPEALTTTHH